VGDDPRVDRALLIAARVQVLHCGHVGVLSGAVLILRV